MPYHVAIYSRKSRQEETNELLQQQLENLIEMVNERGWTYDSYFEYGSSQSIHSRPKMMEMLDGIEQGKYNGVVCRDVDRLTREGMDRHLLMNTLAQGRVFLHTNDRFSNPIDFSNRMDRMVFGMMGTVGESEYASIVERLVNGTKDKAKRGEYQGRKVPCGYRYQKDPNNYNGLPKRLVPSSDMPIIQRMFSLYIDKYSTTDIAHLFEREGIQTLETEHPMVWTSAGISRMLSNPVYCGDSVYGKTTQKKHLVTKQRTYIKKTKDDQITVRDTHEPIVSREDWNKVQMIKNQRNSRDGKKIIFSQNKYGGLLHCALCDKVHSFQHSKGGKKRVTSCTTRHYKDDGSYVTCLNGSCNVSSIDLLVHSALTKYADRFEEFIHLIDAGKMDNSSSIKKLEKEKDNLNKEIARVKRGFKVGIYDEDETLSELNKLNENIERVEKELTGLLNSDGFSEKEYLNEQLEKLKRFLTHGDTVSEKDMNTILGEFIEKIIYKKVGKEIELDIKYRELI